MRPWQQSPLKNCSCPQVPLLKHGACTRHGI
jgi:hypothetical protein